MSKESKKIHSIIFGERSSWDDWHLVPTSRPVFNPPKPKYKTVDVPGGDGLLDMSELLTGYPVYENRTGSFEFMVHNGYEEWSVAYSNIMDYLHGQKLRAILEDDPDYFYEGRYSVNVWKSDKRYSLITIDYNVYPYKQSIYSSTDEWLWDPFNFHTGIALTRKFKNIPVTTEYVPHRFLDDIMGRAPVCPTFDIRTDTGGGIYIRFVNEHLGIDIEKHAPDGKRRYPEFVFRGKAPTLYFKTVTGKGLVSIDYRPGRF